MSYRIRFGPEKTTQLRETSSWSSIIDHMQMHRRRPGIHKTITRENSANHGLRFPPVRSKPPALVPLKPYDSDLANCEHSHSLPSSHIMCFNTLVPRKKRGDVVVECTAQVVHADSRYTLITMCIFQNTTNSWVSSVSLYRQQAVTTFRFLRNRQGCNAQNKDHWRAGSTDKIGRPNANCDVTAKQLRK